MNIEIINKTDQPIFSRKTYELKIEGIETTPKKDDLKKEVVKSLKSKDELTIVEKTTPFFGTSNLKVLAKVYDSEKALKKAEPKPKKKSKEKKE